MGDTTVEYKGREFEANDVQAEVWLLLLSEEVDRLPHAPEWLREARNEWRQEAIDGYGMGVFIAPDRIVGDDDERRRVLLTLSERAMDVLRAQGQEVSAAFLNRLAVANGQKPPYRFDRPTEDFFVFGDYFIKLLQGTLASEEKDSRVWLRKQA